MKTTIGVYEAKTQLSRLIDRAAAGERIVITRNGNAVAELRSVTSERPAPETIVARFKAFRQRQSLQGTVRRPDETLRELAHEGHDRCAFRRRRFGSRKVALARRTLESCGRRVNEG